MGETTWFDLAKKIKLIKKSNSEIIPCSSKQYFTCALRPKNSILDTSRIETHLSLKILDWTSALDDCLNRIEGKGDMSKSKSILITEGQVYRFSLS